jgi:hypothetical protein
MNQWLRAWGLGYGRISYFTVVDLFEWGGLSSMLSYIRKGNGLEILNNGEQHLDEREDETRIQ